MKLTPPGELETCAGRDQEIIFRAAVSGAEAKTLRSIAIILLLAFLAPLALAHPLLPERPCPELATPACAPWQRLASGHASGVNWGTYVFASAEEYQAWWGAHDRGWPREPAPGPVDFSTHFVVALVDWWPSGTGSIEVVDVTHTPTEGYVVSYLVTWVMDIGNVVDEPWDLVAVERADDAPPRVTFVGMYTDPDAP